MLAFLVVLLFLDSAACIKDLNATKSKSNGTNPELDLVNSLDLAKNPHLLFVLFASLSGCIWLLYITFFNSRVVGFIVTKLVNRFIVKDGEAYLKIGSFSLSLLNGKFMFRDVKYITKDYTIRIIDGYAIFAWWLKYVPNESRNYHTLQKHPETQWEIKDDDGSMHRLTVHLNGLEAHLYNRSCVYDRLHEIFKKERFGDARRSTSGIDGNDVTLNTSNQTSSDDQNYPWMDLIPTIKFFINSGKIALGNKLVETTFWIHCNNATANYSTSVATSTMDEYTHVIKGKCEDVRVMLSPSPGYNGTKTQPPRFMGEGFVVLQSGEVEYRYLQDVPGIIPEDLQSAPEADPVWNLSLVFTKSTTITYGPWADKQREKLQRLFLPQDYQEHQALRPVQPGERRVHTGFDLKMKFQAQIAMDILFSKNDELSALHVCAEQASSVHFFMPWTVNEFGYTSTLLLQLQKLELTTSLDFRKLLVCGSMEAELIMTVPRIWNQFQHWSYEFIFNETSVCFIYQHISFIQDLINDWGNTVPADIAYFVPYEWEFKFHFRDYELIFLVNEHNWIDCTSDNENGQLAFCGEALEVSFLLPFTKFLPKTEEIRFFCRAELLVLRMFIPESNTLRKSVLSLVRSSDTRKYVDPSRVNSMVSDADEGAERPECKRENREFKGTPDLGSALSKGWRRKTGVDDTWIDVCSTPVLVLNMFYKFHPIHSANEKIERMSRSIGIDYSSKEPASLEPDLLTVELEAGPLSLKLLGSVFRQFYVGFKENYFGMSQKPTEFDALKSFKTIESQEIPEKETKIAQDARYHRPMHANITIVLLDIKAELTKHCTVGESSSPILNMERLTFEMNKTYRETMLQVITSPATVSVKDGIKRPAEHSHLSKGFLSLSGLQFRGHAFFSDKDCRLGSDTFEYAWQMEIQCGAISGKVTLPQIQAMTMWAEVFLLHVTDDENALTPTHQDIKCQHGACQRLCKHFEAPKLKTKAEDTMRPMLCPTESDLKYKMTRFSMESVNLFIVEMECACNIKASPIRASSCTSHTSKFASGGSIFIHDLVIRQYVQDMSPPEEVDQLNGSSRSHSFYSHSHNWLEVAVVTFGPITADHATCSHDVFLFNEQQAFLRKHDHLLKRLWFLWKPAKLNGKIAADRARSNICGCVGGCKFFGNNVNGVRFFTVQKLDASEMQFSRYGSESIWGGANERQGIEERLRYKNGTISLQSLGGSSLRLRKTSEMTNRKTGAKVKSLKDSDSVGLWSSMSGSVPQSMSYRDSMVSRLPNHRSISQDVGMNLRGRQRTESEGTFYSCESEIASLNNVRDAEDAAEDKIVTGKTKSSKITSDKISSSRCSWHSSMESFVSAVASKEDLAPFDETDSSPRISKPLLSSALASLYGEHLRRSTCKNWKVVTPCELSRRCSLQTNLKAIYLPVRVSTSAILPNFQHDVKGKLPFVVVSKKYPNTQNANGTNDMDGSDDSVFDDQDGSNCQSSSGVAQEVCEQHSTINVKFHKSVDIIVSPVLCQCIERYIHSLKRQEKIQHPAYVMDSLQLRCIDFSKDKHNENHALKALSVPAGDDDNTASKRGLLSDLFPRSSVTGSFIVPCVNFISLQVSSEGFCASEASSLSGQCGSRFSNDFGFTRNACAVAMVASMHGLKLSSVSHGEHKALKDLTVSLLRRRSVFKSSSDYRLLKEIHDLTGSSDEAVSTHIEAIDFQLQRLDCENLAEDSSFVTAIPNVKSLVPFVVYRGDDVDVDDISWLEHKLSNPVGKIMLELGMKKITLDGFYGRKLSLLEGGNNALGKEKQENRLVAQTESQGNVNLNTDQEHKDEVENGESGERMKGTKEGTCKEGDGEVAEQSKLSDYDESCLLLDENEGNSIKNVVLEIQESSEEANRSKLQMKDSKVDGSHVKIRNAHVEKAKSQLGKMKEIDGDEEEEEEEYVLRNTCQVEMKVKKIWFNLAHPTKLKILQEGGDFSVNLISSIVPSICVWIPVYVDLIKVVDLVVGNYRKYRYSLMAYVMGQALPDKGRLYIKHNINSMGTEQATFLQEEHSSQLIFVLRRQLLGAKLRKVEAALEDKAALPDIDVLERGIHALARQWNAVIIGSTRTETMFKSQRRKHVVGRGVLTRKDIAILLRDQSFANEEPFSGKKPKTGKGKSRTAVDGEKSGIQLASQGSVSAAPKPDPNVGGAKEGESHSLADSGRSLLGHNSTDGSTSEPEFDGKPERKDELNLYDWLSATNSPRQKSLSLDHNAAQPSLTHLEAGHVKPSAAKSQPSLDDPGKLLMTSQMVSMPTSGMQLENAREIFRCIFDALDLTSTDKKQYLAEDVYGGNLKLRGLTVHIVSTEESSEDEDSHAGSKFGSSSLMLQDLEVAAHSSEYSGFRENGSRQPVVPAMNHVPKEIKVVVNLGAATQIVNIALIRLLMQITETIDLVKEENRFAQKVKSLEMAAFHTVPKEGGIERWKYNAEVHKGWATMFNVLQLYTEDKTILTEQLTNQETSSEIHSATKEVPHVYIDLTESPSNSGDTNNEGKHSSVQTSPPLTAVAITGTACLAKVRLLAYIGGMDLESEFSTLNGSYLKKILYTQRKMDKGSIKGKQSMSSSISVHLDNANLVLTESFSVSKTSQRNNPQSPRILDSYTTIASCRINKSHVLLSTKPLVDMKEVQRMHVIIGAIDMNIPQHPGVIRTIATRFSKRLEKHFIEIDRYRSSKKAFKLSPTDGFLSDDASIQGSLFSDDITCSLRGVLKSVSVGAVLLPSLRVVYKIGEIRGNGQIGMKTSYHVKMPLHGLHFESNVKEQEFVIESASLTSIDLPPITVRGDYIVNVASFARPADGYAEQRQLEPTKTYSFLRSVVDIGHLEQNLTTDLLNRLIFLQKGFIKEVNQVIHDVDENEPIPFWRGTSNESVTEDENIVPMLYSIQINLKGIQITATTTSSTAVRLHTGIVALELSNRSPNREKKLEIPKRGSYMKLFGRAEVDLMVSLGQFNQVDFMENENDFQSFAYFKTRIGLTNTLQDKPIFHHSQDKETVIITINKPHIFVMPMAVDKGLLVYLHYKNAYDHWIDHTAEVQIAAQHIWNRLPQRQHTEKLYGSVFLQLNVEKLGLSIPLSENASQTVGNRSSFVSTPDHESSCSALVVTVEETSIMCCSKGSFVSQGLFRNFCLRFANDFDSKAEEWIFSKDDVINTCSIPEGTYSLCSRTATQIQSETPQVDKWLMSILWRMCGIEMHFDSNIAKWLSALSNSLTSFVGDTDIADLSSVNDADDEVNDGDVADLSDAFMDEEEEEYDEPDGLPKLPVLLKDKGNNYAHVYSLERQLWRQTRRISELRQVSAAEDVLSKELRILQDIESAVSQEFFKDVRKRLRRTNRKSSGYFELLQSPASIRNLEKRHNKAAERPFARRHSSVERYLETKELDSLVPKHTGDGDESRRIAFDTTDGRLVTDFRSHPNLSDHEIDCRPDVPEKVAGRKKTNADKKKDYLSPESNKVTFSQSTTDVRSDRGSIASQRQNLSSSMLDFQLDVVVDIDSGKCVLHSDKETDSDFRESNSKADLSNSPDLIYGSQPMQMRKDRFSAGDMGLKGYTRRHKSSLFNQPQNNHTTEDTVLLIPGVNVRVHYQSKTTAERQNKAGSYSTSSTFATTSDASEAADNLSSCSNGWKSGSKSAGLHAWLSIQQLPREMILLPSLLDFFDRALAPITLAFQNTDGKNDSASSVDGGNETESMLSSTSDHSSFPVDVVVFINVQPSDIRFSCSPVSKVECLLRIPSLDFVISSTTTPYNQGKASQTVKKGKNNETKPNIKSSKGGSSDIMEADIGGFCVTVCLSRFSFCIFHPYGKQYGSTSERSFLESGLFPGRRKKRGPVPQPISGRKDSLSLNVEFIKFNLFRKRIQECSGSTSKNRKSASSETSDVNTEVQVSITCDIGSAAFSYDMRRLNEILDVPKAWFKRDLFRRMFLGKSGVYVTESAHKSQLAESNLNPSSTAVNSFKSNAFKAQREAETLTPRRPKSIRRLQGHRRTISGGSFLGNIMGSPSGLFLPRGSSSIGSRAEFLQRSLDARKSSDSTLRVPKDVEVEMDSVDGQSSNSKENRVPEWQNKVLFTLNLSRLDVSTNMGNVMGQSVWSTTDLQAQSKMLINNTGIKSSNILVTVRQGSFDAHGGIVGGYIDVGNITAKGNFKDNIGKDPSHHASVTVKGIETRLDYMGSCILMATLSGFVFDVDDKWIFCEPENESSFEDDHFFVYKDVSPRSSLFEMKTELKVDGKLGWNDFQIVMSRSTTPDLIKMCGKLQDFFNQQQRSGMHAFAEKRQLTVTSSFPLSRPGNRIVNKREFGATDKRDDTNEEQQSDGLKYQHWVEILNAFPGLNLINVQSSFADKNVTIGGSLVLKANSVSLTCFHGSNFRAQTWALFSINEPVVSFASEVFCVEKSCQVERAFAKQEISVKLGHEEAQSDSPQQLDFMATVRKVSRGRRNPPSLGASVMDWLIYVTSTSDGSPASSDVLGKASTKPPYVKRVSFAPKVKYENESEMIFGMPCFVLTLTNEHDQPMTTRISKTLSKHIRTSTNPWLSTVPSPHVVESSLTSCFDDGLCVTMDVSLLFFLHDLILTYMKEKDAVSAATLQSGRSFRGSKTVEQIAEQAALESTDAKGASQTENQKKKEKYRQFRSKDWKLEPKIRLLGWVGTRVDPVNIDWVLDKLGFAYASSTIPKWIQRGAMDPIDIALATLLKHLLAEMQIPKDAAE